ncbi:hypothetical protein [Celeribacter sp.]|uniref:hypothetical protein n=1 Tax=Celeribacter sp. TaxID=1890673 RepID=UPI003A944359
MPIASFSRIIALAATLCSGSAYAQSPAGDPWVFIVHEGDTQPAWQKVLPLGDATDEYYYGMMTSMTSWRAGPSGEESFFNWIAEHQQAWDTIEGCYGQPLKKDTMVLSGQSFDLGFDWMIDKLGGDGALSMRPVGPRVEAALIGVETPGGQANYITCSKTGVMSVTNIGADSANRISVGPAANALTKHMPTLQLSATHELGHVLQNNLYPKASKPSAMSNARWITEGATDAVAVTHTQELYGGKDYFGPYANKYYRRFFLSRAYNIPLNHPHQTQSKAGQAGSKQEQLLANIETKTLDLLDYQTNGFWFHILERYLNGNPNGLTSLYKSMSSAAVAQNATLLVDKWLDGIDGKLKGLEHVFPQFLTEYASWPSHRFEGHMSEDKWLRLGFGNCVEIHIPAGASSAKTTFQLAEYAGACIKISVDQVTTLLHPDIQIRFAGPNDLVDDIYLGWAKGNHFNGAPAAKDCYEMTETVGGIAPCLLPPSDGTSAAQYQRYFFLPKIQQVGPRQDTEFLLIASWVPSTSADTKRNFRVEDIEITVSLDKGGLAAGGSGASKKPAETNYATKQGRGPVTAEGEKNPSEASMRDLFTGNVENMPGVSQIMANTLLKQTEGAITVKPDAEEGQSSGGQTQVSFLFKTPLEPGHIGPVEIYAMSEGGGRMGIQNPSKNSSFIIEEYTAETLRFRGVAEVCEGSITSLMSAGSSSDLCKIFPPKRYEATGAIAFPTARNTHSRLKQPPPSEAYRNYQDIRLARLEERFGLSGTMSGNPTSEADNSGNASGIGTTSKQRAAPNCDCGCTSAQRTSGNIQCMLLCGKAWKQCNAP